MMHEGQSRKMRTQLANAVEYELRLGHKFIPLNEYIGRPIRLSFHGHIECIECGRRTNKSFAQGFCFPCMRDSPMNSECIIRPELCRGHLGEGRDPEWERRHHVQEHVVYLAVSSTFKVGITRNDQVPTRWIDQGATCARVIARTPHRCAAGELEVALKSIFTDRTSWQKMLKNDVLDTPDWEWALAQAREATPVSHMPYLVHDEPVIHVPYPVLAYPDTVKSVSFDKQPVVEGELMGIKGQYLLLSGNRVLNIRKHNGYRLTFEA